MYRDNLITRYNDLEKINKIVKIICDSNTDQILNANYDTDSVLLDTLDYHRERITISERDTIYHVGLITRMSDVFSKDQIEFLNSFSCDYEEVLHDIANQNERDFFYASNIYYIRDYELALIDNFTTITPATYNRNIDNYSKFTDEEKQKCISFICELPGITDLLEYKFVNDELRNSILNSKMIE